MAFSSPSSSTVAIPNVTPLIDVLLVLLIIFMVIVPVSSRGLQSFVPSPSTAAKAQDRSEPLLLEIAAPKMTSGPIAYRLGSREVAPQRLRESLLQARSSREDRVVFVSGDPRLDYGVVAAALGLIHEAGFRDVGLLSRAR